jgi:hypothetical protein
MLLALRPDAVAQGTAFTYQGIEDLTLYVIDQNKRLAAQDERIRQLEALLNDQKPLP